MPGPDESAASGRAVELARARVLGAPEVARAAAAEIELAAADDAIALELVRRVPEPLRPSAIDGLLAELGRTALHDQLVLERIATAPPDARDPALRRVSELARAGRHGPRLAAATAFLRGATERCDGAADLFADSLRSELDVAAFSRRAFERVLARERGRGRGGAVAELERTLAARHPDRPRLELDAATSLLLAGELERADAAFAAVAERERDAVSTAALERRGTAELGRAWLASFRGDPAAAADALRRATAWPRALLPHEDPLHVLELRAVLVAAVAGVIGRARAAEELARAIERTPVDQERCFVDEACYGPLGPPTLSSLLRWLGRSEELLQTELALCAAIEATRRRHGHGLLDRTEEADESQRERLKSWTFLGAAERLLTDRGDPAAALDFLEPRLAGLTRAQLWSNLELAASARLLEARCRTYSGDAAAALAATQSAIDLAAALRASAGRDYIRRLVHDEAPPPPSSRLVFRADPPYSSLTSRALVARSNVEATLMGDVEAAAATLFEAGATWPWDEERWLKCALDFARRGRDDEARRGLACVEASPDHAYDRACVFAQLGEREPALAALEQHLAWGARTPAGRALELAFMARDHDLAPLRDDPAFPRE